MEEELNKTQNLKNIKIFHESFVKFLRVVIFLQNALNCFSTIDNTLLESCRNECLGCSNFDDIKNEINDVDIKNIGNSKISKFTLQIYSYAYKKLMDFSRARFDYQTLTTSGFFETIYKIINVKIHLHHSHVGRKIYGYAHDFCNMKVRENQTSFTCIAHNFFKFDKYYLLEGIKLPVWNMKDTNIRGNELTDINFSNLCTQVKLVDTLKYYLAS